MSWESLAAFIGSEASLVPPTSREPSFTLPEPMLRPCFADPEAAEAISRGIHECIPAKLTTVIKNYSSRPTRELPLLTILKIFKDSLCTHPNDRIFSLVSMMKEKEHVEIDYNLHLHELCWRIVRDLQTKAGVVVDLEQAHGLLCDQQKLNHLPCERLWDHGYGSMSMSLQHRATVAEVLQVRAEHNPGALSGMICGARKDLHSQRGRGAGSGGSGGGGFVNDALGFVRFLSNAYLSAVTNPFNARDDRANGVLKSATTTTQLKKHVDCGSELLRSLLLSVLDCQSFENPPHAAGSHCEDRTLDIQWKTDGYSNLQSKISCLGNALLDKLNSRGGWVAVCADGSVCVSSCGIERGDSLCFDPAFPSRSQLVVVRTNRFGQDLDPGYAVMGTAKLVVNSCGCLDCIGNPSSTDRCDCAEGRHLPDMWKNGEPHQRWKVERPTAAQQQQHQIHLQTTEWRCLSINQHFGMKYWRKRQVAFLLKYDKSESSRDTARNDWERDASFNTRYVVCEWALAPEWEQDAWSWALPWDNGTNRRGDGPLPTTKPTNRGMLGQQLISMAQSSPTLESLVMG